MLRVDMKRIIAAYERGENMTAMAEELGMTPKQLQELITKELTGRQKSESTGTKTLTLDDGRTVRVYSAVVQTTKQPNGGTIDVYLEGKDNSITRYYVYKDANGKVTKTTDYYNTLEATFENWDLVRKLYDQGKILDATMALFSGAEDPRGLATGFAPLPSTTGFNFKSLKGLKNIKEIYSQLKNAKNFAQFKSLATGFLQKMKLPKGAKQLEDGTFYAQQRVSLSQGKWKATPIVKHAGSLEEAIPNRNPWGNTDFFREIKYNPVTKTTQICETNGGRFATLKDITSDGKCTYTVLEPKSGGKIVYKGYNDKFQPVSGVEQSITCIDTKGNVLAEFNGTQIKKGLSTIVEYSQDICAKKFLDVKILESGPPSADFSVGNFRELVDLMKFVVRK